MSRQYTYICADLLRHFENFTSQTWEPNTKLKYSEKARAQLNHSALQSGCPAGSSSSPDFPCKNKDPSAVAARNLKKNAVTWLFRARKDVAQVRLISKAQDAGLVKAVPGLERQCTAAAIQQIRCDVIIGVYFGIWRTAEELSELNAARPFAGVSVTHSRTNPQGLYLMHSVRL